MARDYIDAKYKVIRQPKRGWRLYIDWRNFLLIAALVVSSGAAALVRDLTPSHPRQPAEARTGSAR